tara:strand:+ start:95 stop:550 length:456 start_codon:yes stop_codon:yes gene_type:complete
MTNINNKYVEKDYENLINSLENEGNYSIMNLNSSIIMEHKNNILQKLNLERNELKKYHKKLKKYRYCSDLSDLQFGNYIRWISLKDPDKIFLTNGAFFSDYVYTKDSVKIVCRNSRGFTFQIKFDEVIIFQILNNQEQVLLKVMDYLNKNN